MIFRFQAGGSRRNSRPRLEVCLGVACILLPLTLFAEPDADAPERLYPEATLSLAALASPSAPDIAMTQPGPAAPEPPATTPALATSASFPTSAPPVITPIPIPVTALTTTTVVDPFLARFASNSLPPSLAEIVSATNGLPRHGMSEREILAHQKQRLEIARYLRTSRQPHESEPILIQLLKEQMPEDLQQSTLLELAAVAQDLNEATRAQQIYAQFLSKWSNDLRVPEILLRQGMIFRQMGLYNLALTKFYSVMTSALILKNDELDFYVRLVNQAQTQIAETHFELGKYAEAADFFNRLLKQNNANINKPSALYKLTRCHSAVGKYAEAVADAQDFLVHYPDSPEQPEIRFYLAVALKQLGRDNESLQQVLFLLQEQRARTKDRPEVWAYWQQRAGNLIANQLYREGDYSRALEIYQSLTRLDSSPNWQVPLSYQIGMTYERLWQPQKAIGVYNEILTHEKDLGPDTPPGLKTVFEMARWRISFIQWQEKADSSNRQIRLMATNRTVTASLETPSRPTP